MIENLLNADDTAKIYVEVYGFEEDDNGDLAPVSDFSKNDYFVYYCWWD